MIKLIFCNILFNNKEAFCSALIKNNEVIELNLKPREDSIKGNVYVGKITNILPNINSIFIKATDGVECYLPFKEANNAIYTSHKKNKEPQIGDELIISIESCEMKGKLPRATTKITEKGQFLVLTNDGGGISYSSKLNDNEKTKVKELISEIDLPKGFGLIVRTNGKNGTKDEILGEYKRLNESLTALINKGKTRKCFSLIKNGSNFVDEIINSGYINNIDEIVTDNDEVFTYLSENYNELSYRKYDDKFYPMYKCYSLETAIDSGTQKKVWLKNGGFLYIEQTEAMVVIDVNSGKDIRKKKDTYKETNYLAAEEIARQLRLRSLSGIILVDFINVKDRDYQKELIKFLEEKLKSDPVTTRVVDFTKLQIMELTRRKLRVPLKEQIMNS